MRRNTRYIFLIGSAFSDIPRTAFVLFRITAGVGRVFKVFTPLLGLKAFCDIQNTGGYLSFGFMQENRSFMLCTLLKLCYEYLMCGGMISF